MSEEYPVGEIEWGPKEKFIKPSAVGGGASILFIGDKVLKRVDNENNFDKLSFLCHLGLEVKMTILAGDALPGRIPKIEKIMVKDEKHKPSRKSHVDVGFDIYILENKMKPIEEWTLEKYIKFCELISKLHEKGIIHGDLHLGNTMETFSGEPAFIDFGSSCEANDPISQLFDYSKFTYFLTNVIDRKIIGPSLRDQITDYFIDNILTPKLKESFGVVLDPDELQSQDLKILPDGFLKSVKYLVKNRWYAFLEDLIRVLEDTYIQNIQFLKYLEYLYDSGESGGCPVFLKKASKNDIVDRGIIEHWEAVKTRKNYFLKSLETSEIFPSSCKPYLETYLKLAERLSDILFDLKEKYVKNRLKEIRKNMEELGPVRKGLLCGKLPEIFETEIKSLSDAFGKELWKDVNLPEIDEIIFELTKYNLLQLLKKTTVDIFWIRLIVAAAYRKANIDELEWDPLIILAEKEISGGKYNQAELESFSKVFESVVKGK